MIIALENVRSYIENQASIHWTGYATSTVSLPAHTRF